jgi:hypothetical protein
MLSASIELDGIRSKYAKATSIGVISMNEKLLPDATGLLNVAPSLSACEPAASIRGFSAHRVCVKCGAVFALEHWNLECSATPDTFTHTGDLSVPKFEEKSPQLLTPSMRASFFLVWLPLSTAKVNDSQSVVYTTPADVDATPVLTFLIDEIAYDFDIKTIVKNQWLPFSRRCGVEFIPFVVHSRNKTYIRYK